MEKPAIDLRRELIERFPVRPWIYWVDFIASGIVGWGAFAVAVATPARNFAVFAPSIVVAALALWRAGYFIHEISHQRRALPGFEAGWNAIVGVWLLLPSFMIDAHVDHHRPSTYGTLRDPEYERVATFSRASLLLNVAAMPIVPPLLVLRFAILAPLSCVSSRVRRLVLERASALVTNERYRNGYAKNTVRLLGLEGATTGVVWGFVVGFASAHVPIKVGIVWYAVVTLALTVNLVRTLVAHAYEGTGEPMSFEEQLADSSTVEGPWWSTGVVHPVGTRYHALHHLAPSLPYHALGAAHRWLLANGNPAELQAYRASEHRGFVRALSWLWRRASSRTLVMSRDDAHENGKGARAARR